LHFAAAQGLHFAAAQGLHGLHLAAAQGLTFFAAHCASAGAVLVAPITTTPPTATPANTTKGITVLDSSVRFVEIITSLPRPGFSKLEMKCPAQWPRRHALI
jgi:hypothetical protein